MSMISRPMDDLSLDEQARIVACAAMEMADDTKQHQVLAAAETLSRLAASQARKVTAAEENPILDLPGNASEAEVRAARQRRAVRRGTDVYLPSWSEMAIGLPNVLLRSALFAVTSTERGWVKDMEIASHGDSSILFTGELLGGYDRKTFATCIDHYQEGSTLCREEGSIWVHTTFYQFAKAMNLTYGAGVHRAIRASLLRLNAANLRVRVGRLNIPIPRLVEVAFDEQQASPDSESPEELRGSDGIAFRIHQPIANLFGPATWTAVPKAALHSYAGLAGWICCFYSTHKAPFLLPLSTLYQRSGVTCNKAEFRRLLNTALHRLKGEDVPSALRVERYTVTKNQVWVCLERWKYKGRTPLEPAE